MAKNQEQSQDTTIETIIRRMVREEVASMFANITSFSDDSYQEDDGETAEVGLPQPTSLSASGTGSPVKRRRRRKSNGKAQVGKGRATNRATDRRFKENRANA